jgi:hypothetical protein
LLAVEVRVTVACPEPLVVALPPERLPALVLKLMFRPVAGLPPMVKVAVMLLLVTPSATIDVGVAEMFKTTPRKVIVEVSAEKPRKAATVAVALPLLLDTGAV